MCASSTVGWAISVVFLAHNIQMTYPNIPNSNRVLSQQAKKYSALVLGYVHHLSRSISKRITSNVALCCCCRKVHCCCSSHHMSSSGASNSLVIGFDEEAIMVIAQALG